MSRKLHNKQSNIRCCNREPPYDLDKYSRDSCPNFRSLNWTIIDYPNTLIQLWTYKFSLMLFPTTNQSIDYWNKFLFELKYTSHSTKNTLTNYPTGPNLKNIVLLWTIAYGIRLINCQDSTFVLTSVLIASFGLTSTMAIIAVIDVRTIGRAWSCSCSYSIVTGYRAWRPRWPAIKWWRT